MLMSLKTAELRKIIMNIIDLRNKLQQSSMDSRIADRRKVGYLFGSPEWLEYTKNNNLKSLAADRRNTIRRSEDQEPATNTKIIDSNTHYKRIFLTAGEKRLLQDIYLSDFD
jgi:hypothetical protein